MREVLVTQSQGVEFVADWFEEDSFAVSLSALVEDFEIR